MGSLIKKRRTETPHAVQYIHSGSDVLDYILGGGWPRGRIVNIVGDRSTGKTLLAIELVVFIIKVLAKIFAKTPDRRNKSKVRVVYDAAEGAVEFNLQKTYGIKQGSITWKYSDTVEEFSANFGEVVDSLPSDTVLVYVLDSLDSLSCVAERKRVTSQQKKTKSTTEEDKKKKGSFKMDKATLMNEFFRMYDLQLKQKDIMLVIISQVRKNIGVMFGPTQRRSCADALDFYEVVELWLRESEKVKKTFLGEELIVGIRSKCTVKKLKVGVPYRTAVVNFNFEKKGKYSIVWLDNIGSNIDFLYQLLTKGGKLNPEKKSNNKTLLWDGDLYTRRGLIEHIEENNLESELTKRVKGRWEEIEEAARHDRKAKYSEYDLEEEEELEEEGL